MCGSAQTMVVQNILQEACLVALEADADALADCPNYWVPRDVVEGVSPALTVAEQAVQQLYQRLVTHQLALQQAEWQGAEYWCQVYEGGRGLGFHFDKDEHVMAQEARMLTPILSSVLYLTGSRADPVRQAPTVLIDQWYDQRHGGVVPEHPAWSTLVFPVRNQYCLFPGRQAHGVLEGMLAPQPTSPQALRPGQPGQEGNGSLSQQQQQQQQRQQRRVTFLVNWWAQRPQRVLRATAEDVAAGRLAAARDSLAPADNAAAREQAVALAGLSLEEEKEEDVSATPPQHHPEQQTLQRIAFVGVDAPALESGEVLPVDELLQQQHVRINSHPTDCSSICGTDGGVGRAAADAVTIRHPGLTLVPLDEEQVDPAHPLQVLAALLPTADLASEGSSSGSSSEDDA